MEFEIQFKKNFTVPGTEIDRILPYGALNFKYKGVKHH